MRLIRKNLWATTSQVFTRVCRHTTSFPADEMKPLLAVNDRKQTLLQRVLKTIYKSTLVLVEQLMEQRNKSPVAKIMARLKLKSVGQTKD